MVPGPPQSSRAHLAVPEAGLMNLPMKRHLVCVSGLRVWDTCAGSLSAISDLVGLAAWTQWIAGSPGAIFRFTQPSNSTPPSDPQEF